MNTTYVKYCSTKDKAENDVQTKITLDFSQIIKGESVDDLKQAIQDMMPIVAKPAIIAWQNSKRNKEVPKEATIIVHRVGERGTVDPETVIKMMSDDAKRALIAKIEAELRAKA